MQDLRQTLKRLFETTGEVNYYLMLKALDKKEEEKE